MRSSRRKLAALVFCGAVVAAACGEQPTAPAPSLALGGGLQEGIESFQVHPGRARSFVIGDHKISFDADAICDPRTSTYGPGEWDAPCEAAATPVRITATATRDVYGRPSVYFEPQLRFRPDKNVTLYLMDKEAAADSANAKIVWIDPLGNLVDEAATDSSLATYVGENGFLYRRLKHFSTYTVNAGRDLY